MAVYAQLEQSLKLGTNSAEAAVAKDLWALMRKEAAKSVHFWLRHEVKPMEHRAAISPSGAKILVDAGIRLTVERSTERIFKDDEYAAVGCELVETASWPQAPDNAYIIGLKELPEGTTPLKHKHIMFGHAFKGQGGWAEFLQRFVQGNGTLLDLEYLVNQQGRRVAAFGFPAGYAGAAVALLTWAQVQMKRDTPLPGLDFFPSDQALEEFVAKRITEVEVAKGIARPRAIIIGALGRAGSGALAFLKAVGCDGNVTKWDMAETAAGGPFEQILEHDIVINCILLTSQISPFLTQDMIDRPSKALSVVCDVSCDTSNPFNPLPFLNRSTTFDSPTFRLATGKAPVDGVAIDHLPSLIPRSCSEMYGSDLLPYLLALIPESDPERARVWEKAREVFTAKCLEASRQ